MDRDTLFTYATISGFLSLAIVTVLYVIIMRPF